jgi:RES domain-containing protein
MLGLYRELTPDTILDDEDPLVVGDLLETLVQDDWGIFSARLFDAERAGDLLVRIGNVGWDDDSGETPLSATELYTRRRSWSHETLEQQFAAVLEEIGGDPDNPENPARLAEALGEELASLARPIRRERSFYRGRPGVDANGVPFSGDAIGAPPPGMGGAGRANPAGVSMLYVAREAATATAELRVRESQGPLSMSRIRAARDLTVVDLVDGYPRINPFTTSDETLFWDVEVAELLRLFGEALSQPVQDDDDPQEYVVTQQLCTAVRVAGYDGIRYGSTRVDRDVNLVLFDPGSGVVQQPSWRIDD